MAALLTFLRVLLLSALLFPVGLATHEVLHLAIYSAFGVPASLVVTRWRLGLTGTSIFGLHAAPANAAQVPLDVLVANNGLGPGLAALLLVVLWAAVDRRSRTARAALLANVLALLFFAAIEVAYPLLEEVGHVDADVLLLPEVDYGVTLLILLGAAGAAAWRSTSMPRLRIIRGRHSPPAGRLPAP
jgi:hypothetical protein